jgi:hypothetical protein
MKNSFFSGKRRRKASKNSPLFELARVFVRFNHVARVIVNADHSAERPSFEIGRGERNFIYAAVRVPDTHSFVVPGYDW